MNPLSNGGDEPEIRFPALIFKGQVLHIFIITNSHFRILYYINGTVYVWSARMDTTAPVRMPGANSGTHFPLSPSIEGRDF